MITGEGGRAGVMRRRRRRSSSKASKHLLTCCRKLAMEFRFLQRLPRAQTGSIDGSQFVTISIIDQYSSSYRMSLAAEDLKSLD
jgi:hypothetical protein